MAMHKELFMWAAQQQLDGPAAGTLEIVGRMDPYAGDYDEVVVQGNRKYTRNWRSGIVTVTDITTPSNSRPISSYVHYPDLWKFAEAYGIAIYGDYLFCATRTGFAVLTVTNDEIVFQEDLELERDCWDLFVNGDVLCVVTIGTFGVIGHGYTYDLLQLPTVELIHTNQLTDPLSEISGINRLYSNMHNGVYYARNVFGTGERIVFGVDFSDPNNIVISERVKFPGGGFSPTSAAISGDGSHLYLGGNESLAEDPSPLKVVERSTMTEVGSLTVPHNADRLRESGGVLYANGHTPGDFSEGRFLEADVSTPSAPTLLGNTVTGARRLRSLAIEGTVAYVGAFGVDGDKPQAQVLDISTPGSPVVINNVEDFPTRLSHVNDYWDATIDGSDMFLVGSGRLFSIDLTDKHVPKRVGILGGDITNDFFGVGIAKVGNRVFTDSPRSGEADGITCVDVTDPLNMQKIGRVTVAGDTFDGQSWLTSYGNYVIGSAQTSNKVFMFDATVSPIENTTVYEVVVPNNPMQIATQGDFAYIACDSNLLAVVNISDPPNLGTATVHQSPSIAGNANLVVVSGDFAFVKPWFGGQITSLNIADPTNIQILDTYTPANLSWGAAKLWLHQDKLVITYLEGDNSHPEMEVVDIADPAVMVRVGSLKLFSGPNNWQDNPPIAVASGNKCYVIAASPFPLFFAVRMT